MFPAAQDDEEDDEEAHSKLNAKVPMRFVLELFPASENGEAADEDVALVPHEEAASPS